MISKNYLDTSPIGAFLKILFAVSETVFPINPVLYLKDLKLLLLTVLTLKLIVASLE